MRVSQAYKVRVPKRESERRTHGAPARVPKGRPSDSDALQTTVHLISKNMLLRSRLFWGGCGGSNLDVDGCESWVCLWTVRWGEELATI